MAKVTKGPTYHSQTRLVGLLVTLAMFDYVV